MFVFLVPLLALAMQNRPAADPPRAPALPKNLAELVDRARSVPPEFAADALLRIAESDAAKDPHIRKELIQEAFNKAGGAEQPMKRRGIRPGAADSRASFQSRAFAQDLDALSLQSRAVIDMVKADKALARELFSRIALPRPPKLSCADMLVYDVSAYYQALGEVAGKTFTAREVAEDKPAKMLAGAAGSIGSATDVGPAARMLASSGLGPAQLQMAVTSFAAALKSLAADDRSFSYTMSASGAALNDLAALVAACKRQEVSTAALVEAIRGYLVRQMSGKRCADTGGMSVTMSVGNVGQTPQPDTVTFFNSAILAEAFPSATGIQPLTGDETRASSVEDPVEPEQPLKTAELTEITDRYNGLIFNTLGVSWSSEQKAETVWQSKLREYLTLLAAWKPSESGNQADYFYRKCYLLSSLVNVVPNGPDRVLVLRSYFDFLQQNGYQRGSRMEWFLPVNTLLFRVLTDSALAELAEEMRNSGDAVVALYARLNTLVPPSPAAVMPLL